MTGNKLNNITIEDYFSGEAVKKLDKIHQDVLQYSNYFDNHNINELNEEKYNSLGLALKFNNLELANILVDKGIDLNNICERNEHIVLECFQEDEILLKILKSDKLINKPLVFKQLVQYSSFQESSISLLSEVFQILEGSVNSLSRKDLIWLEIKIDNSRELINSPKKERIAIWNKFKQENNITISSQDIFEYLIKETQNPYVFSEKNIINKKIIKENIALNEYLIMMSGQDYDKSVQTNIKNLNVKRKNEKKDKQNFSLNNALINRLNFSYKIYTDFIKDKQWLFGLSCGNK